jgi:hypothetical protein
LLSNRHTLDAQIFFQGAGAGETVLYFPRPLSQVYGNAWANGISQYAFGPGYINWNGAPVCGAG